MTNKRKNTRIFYKDTKHLKMWEALPEADCKELLLALLRYEPGMDMSDCFSNPLTFALFSMEAEQIDLNEKKYQEVSETKRQAANKRWNKEETAPTEEDKIDEDFADVVNNLSKNQLSENADIVLEKYKPQYIDAFNSRNWDYKHKVVDKALPGLGYADKEDVIKELDRYLATA